MLGPREAEFTLGPSRIAGSKRHLAYFRERVALDAASGCWLWTAGRSVAGYGIFTCSSERPMQAHRASWMLHRSEIPKGAVVRHFVCDNPPCVNPEHLRLGSHADNAADRVRSGRTCAAVPGGVDSPRVTSHRWLKAGTVRSIVSFGISERLMVPSGILAQLGRRGPDLSFATITGAEVVLALGERLEEFTSAAEKRGIGLGDLVAELALKAPE